MALKKFLSSSCRLVDGTKSIQSLSLSFDFADIISEERLRILSLLCQSPDYMTNISRKLEIPIQNLHYHLRALSSCGLVEFREFKQINGGIAKIYFCKSNSLSFVMSKKWAKNKSSYNIPGNFILPFVDEGVFDGLMVVGSPDPHGKYRARASDLSVLDFAMYLGQFASFKPPLYVLDTQLRTEDKKRALIVAGGPKVNTLFVELNNFLKIKFSRDFSEIRDSSKKYSGNIGFIELTKNPFNPNVPLLAIGGLNQNGTRAAILSLMKETNSKSNRYIVEGFDEDGDGIVDSFELIH